MRYLRGVRNVPASQIIGYAAIAFALYASRRELPPVTTGDLIMFAILGLLFTWFLWPSRGDAAGHEQPDKSVAFRLGKSLKRVIRR